MIIVIPIVIPMIIIDYNLLFDPLFLKRGFNFSLIFFKFEK